MAILDDEIKMIKMKWKVYMAVIKDFLTNYMKAESSIYEVKIT